MVTGTVVLLRFVDQTDGVHFLGRSLMTGFLVDQELLWVAAFRSVFGPISIHLMLHK